MCHLLFKSHNLHLNISIHCAQNPFSLGIIFMQIVKLTHITPDKLTGNLESKILWGAYFYQAVQWWSIHCAQNPSSQNILQCKNFQMKTLLGLVNFGSIYQCMTLPLEDILGMFVVNTNSMFLCKFQVETSNCTCVYPQSTCLNV